MKSSRDRIRFDHVSLRSRFAEMNLPQCSTSTCCRLFRLSVIADQRWRLVKSCSTSLQDVSVGTEERKRNRSLIEFNAGYLQTRVWFGFTLLFDQIDMSRHIVSDIDSTKSNWLPVQPFDHDWQNSFVRAAGQPARLFSFVSSIIRRSVTLISIRLHAIGRCCADRDRPLPFLFRSAKLEKPQFRFSNSLVLSSLAIRLVSISKARGMPFIFSFHRTNHVQAT